MKRMNSGLLIESVTWESSAADEAGVLKDVKILGRYSRNRREYTPEAMKAAVGLYEGKAVYISHAGEKVKHRALQERYGRLQAVRFDEARNELRGNLVYLESQEQTTKMVREDLARKLNFFGLSHVADGDFTMREGVQVVHKITKVDTVDLVSDPATATSLKEQADAPAAPADPNAAPAGPDHHVEALRGGLMAILDGGGDLASMVAKITEFLDTFGDAAAKSEPAEAPKAEEQTLQDIVAKLQEQVAILSKPRKYITPAPVLKAVSLAEQADNDLGDAPPKDKDALRKWLRTR